MFGCNITNYTITTIDSIQENEHQFTWKSLKAKMCLNLTKFDDKLYFFTYLSSTIKSYFIRAFFQFLSKWDGSNIQCTTISSTLKELEFASPVSLSTETPNSLYMAMLQLPMSWANETTVIPFSFAFRIKIFVFSAIEAAWNVPSVRSILTMNLSLVVSILSM